MESSFTTITDWCARERIAINTSKTEFLLFTPGLRFRPGISAYRGGVAVPASRTVRYLGLLLDPALTFLPHARAVVAKATCRFHQLRGAFLAVPASEDT